MRVWDLGESIHNYIRNTISFANTNLLRMPDFKKGDKVHHKANPEFNMVIIGFDTIWLGDLAKSSRNEPNPDHPICEYYNVHTSKWETKQFLADALELNQPQ